MNISVQRLAGILRARLAQDIGHLAIGTGISQFALFIAMPVILHLYGAEAFGIYATILGLVAVLNGATTLRIDVVIPFIETRHRALRLVSAVVGIITIATTGEYLLVAFFFACCKEWLPFLAQTVTPYIWWIPIIVFGQTIFVACRAWMIRCSAFKLATLCQLIRTTLFLSCSIGLGVTMPESRSHIAYGLLAAQLCSDLSAIGFFLCRTRRRERRLLLPLPPWRAIYELQANRSFIGTSFFMSMLAIINQNIPIWTIGYVFGMQSAGWFSAAQRVVMAPVQFAISTAGVAFTQNLRKKRARGHPIAADVMRLMLILCSVLCPIFGSLGWLAHSRYLAVLGADWAGAGSTLAALVIIAFGSVFYSAIESLPLLFRLNRFLLVYHSARFVMTILISMSAFLGIFSYGFWIYVYASGEMLLYAINAIFVVAYVRRAERA